MKIGTHKAKALEAALCRSTSGSANDYIGVVFEVVDGDCKGEKISGMMFWTEATKERTRKALDAMGWKGEVDSECNLVSLPNVVSIGVIEDTYNGKTRMKLDWVFEMPVGISSKDRLTMRDAKGLLDEMRRGMKSVRQAPRGDAYEGPDPL